MAKKTPVLGPCRYQSHYKFELISFDFVLRKVRERVVVWGWGGGEGEKKSSQVGASAHKVEHKEERSAPLFTGEPRGTADGQQPRSCPASCRRAERLDGKILFSTPPQILRKSSLALNIEETWICKRNNVYDLLPKDIGNIFIQIQQKTV